MKRLILTAIVASGLLAFPRAQDRARVFTTGTAAELAVARTRGVAELRGTALARGIADELRVSRVTVDRESMAHTRVQQVVRGVPVLGGEAIAHFTSDGELFTTTDALLSNVVVNTTPAITAAAAIDVAVTAYGCRDCLTETPTADLWVLRQNGADHLVYRVQLQRLDGSNETALPVIFVDAHGGFVVSRYDNLQTASGSSLYSGTVTIGTRAYPSLYAMENHTTRIGTWDMRNGTTTAFFFIDSDDLWDSPTQRAGVDAHYGMERFFNYLSSIHGRNGIDGSGGPFLLSSLDGLTTLVTSVVHYGVNYNNAFWSSSGFMAYGDGDGVQLSPLVTLDIAGHEMTHGVIQYTANLIYQGESGALNESWADVFGAMLERHVKGESANTWLSGEQAFTPAIAGDAGRYMDDPHRASNKGFTADDDPDHYSERYTGAVDNGGVHINSGIANKAFYLLAKGGAHHLGGSMTGIGADAAARIWFNALSFMTTTTNFAQARTATLNAAAALYGSGGVQHTAVSAAWCLVGVGTCGVPTADSVTPGSGTGTSQIFTLNYSNSQGATNLSAGWVWFNATFAPNAANSCLAYYERPSHTVFLLNDAGTTWLSGPMGTAATLQNSQCSIALASSGASSSGNQLTVNLAMTFKAPFAGAKNIYMYAATAAGAISGWQDRGDWMAASPAVITSNSVTPASGSGASQTFALQYSDSLGATDLLKTWVWFNATFAPSAANSCLVYYERPANSIFLLNDAGTAWTSGTAGAGGALQNSQCSIALGSSSAAPVGTTLTVNLAMTFKTPFAGAKNVYLYAENAAGASSGWQDRGDWTVPSTAVTVTADSVTPDAGSGASQTFALAYSSTLGATNLTTTWVWFDATFANSAANSCLVYYDRPAHTLFLLNDAGTVWMSSGMGSGSTLQNAQCAIDPASSSATPSGNTLTVSLAVTFKAAFNGAKNIFMYGTNGTVDSGWQDRGDWTVAAVGEAVTADSATPNSGSGASQTFALAYSSTLGATNLTTTWVWFNATFANSAANSCLVYYDRPAHTLFLLNDAGTVWMSSGMGSGSTLQNAQCAIDPASSSATPSGNTLTVNLAVTFKAAFNGAKNIFMYGTNGTLNSGWQDRGDWTVVGVGEAVTADSATPNSGSGASQTFALAYSSTLGATNLTTTWVWFNASFAESAANSCLAYYDRTSHTLFLLDDAGTTWMSSAMGSGPTLQNSQCAIEPGSSGATPSGNTLTLTLALTFKNAFAGAKSIFMYGTNGAVNSGWQTRGTWTVP
jgi:Zn-dependent metalloprotease